MAGTNGSEGKGGKGKVREKEEGITVKKSEDFSEWYTQVVTKGGFADYGPVQGTIAYMPNSYAIWERIQQLFGKMIRETGHRNVYFPLLIPESFLTKEKDHIEGFAPEVFWVTHGGSQELGERYAIRPTSETIIYSFYSKWVRSWRDLPLLLNQWCNILRAEIKSTKPFVRGSEFLWQEGHTVHETEKDADREVMMILGFYKELVERYLAIPVIVGRKSEKEKFAGALYTTTIELMMPDGKALQGGTSHNLGQNFSKPFGIKFLDRNNQPQFAWTTSWGISTRLIGAVLMVHGDDKGAVIPPEMAPVHAAIVPIYKSGEEAAVLKKAREVKKRLEDTGLSVVLDERDDKTPGWKFSQHELEGVPLRIEIGPRDVKEGKVVVVRRDTSEKASVSESGIAAGVEKLLETMQKDMLARARAALEKQTHSAKDYQKLKETIEKGGGFVKADWCGAEACEMKIKDETGATVRAIPFDEEKRLGDCVVCGKKAKHSPYFARSY